MLLYYCDSFSQQTAACFISLISFCLLFTLMIPCFLWFHWNPKDHQGSYPSHLIFMAFEQASSFFFFNGRTNIFSSYSNPLCWRIIFQNFFLVKVILSPMLSVSLEKFVQPVTGLLSRSKLTLWEWFCTLRSFLLK